MCTACYAIRNIKSLVSPDTLRIIYFTYVHSLIMFTVNNKHLYNTNNEIHNYRTRYKDILHLPIASLAKFNKGTNIFHRHKGL